MMTQSTQENMETIKVKKARTLKDLENSPYVECVDIDDEGIWMWLNEGYGGYGAAGERMYHEYTVKELCKQFNLGLYVLLT